MQLHRQFTLPEEEEEQLSPPHARPSSPSPPSSPFSRTLTHQTHFADFRYLSLRQILAKPHALRTHNDLRFLADFVRNAPALKDLLEATGPDFCRGLLRAAAVEEYASGELLAERGEAVETVWVVLEGRVGTLRNEDDSDMLQTAEMGELFELLTGLARKENRRSSRLARRGSSCCVREDGERRVRWAGAGGAGGAWLERLEKGAVVGLRERAFGAEWSHAVVAAEGALVLSVDTRNLFFWLHHCFQAKLERSFALLKSHSCFSQLDDLLLEDIVAFMTLCRRRAHQTVYCQGEPATHIYFLEEGELHIEKTANLLLDNPNDLYLDRRALMTPREQERGEYLPYADLRHLYNYQPQKKTLELGVLTPFCLFGEEEIVAGRNRETTVRCASIEAIYYSLELTKIYAALGEQTPFFLQAIRNSVGDKIRHRQQTYASAMQLENQQHLNFYDPPRPTPRHQRIRKINSHLAQQAHSHLAEQAHSHLATPPHSQTATPSAPPSPPSAATLAPIPLINPEQRTSIPPLYNTFNFHKLGRRQGSGSPGREVPLCAAESRIMGNSHTWREVEAKVRREGERGRRMGSLKHRINFGTPLIEEGHFRAVEAELKRIERERKTGKFAVSAPRAARRPCLSTLA